jgi:hypothetical protein
VVLRWALPLFGWTPTAILLTDLYYGEFRQYNAATQEAALDANALT